MAKDHGAPLSPSYQPFSSKINMNEKTSKPEAFSVSWLKIHLKNCSVLLEHVHKFFMIILC